MTGDLAQKNLVQPATGVAPPRGKPPFTAASALSAAKDSALGNVGESAVSGSDCSPTFIF